jgi:hypothetical protein
MQSTDGRWTDEILIKSRAGIQFKPKRKLDILHQRNGLCQYGEIGSMKHIISERLENLGKIINMELS